MSDPVTSLRQEFFNWAAPRETSRDHYRLYREILNGIPEPEAFWTFVLQTCGHLKPSTRKNHFFAAVQYLVLKNPAELLAFYFPSSPAYDPKMDSAGAGTVFWEFVQRRSHEIMQTVRAREVQINKLGRLALFAPLFLEVARRCPQPLAFVEVGSSIGFGLLWPHFRYSYPERGQITGADANSELSCHIEGTPTLFLNGILPDACSLCGIESSPLSASNPEDVRWLVALTAPGDAEGRLRLRLGLDMITRRKPRIEHGCVLDVLPRLEPNLPRNAALVVYHAMTLHHLRDDDKSEEFRKLLQRIGAQRRTFELGVEWIENTVQDRYHPTPVELTFTEWTVNGPQINRIGETDQAADGILLKFF